MGSDDGFNVEISRVNPVWVGKRAGFGPSRFLVGDSRMINLTSPHQINL